MYILFDINFVSPLFPVLRYNLELRYYLEMLALEIHRRRYAHQIDEPTRPLLLKPGIKSSLKSFYKVKVVFQIKW